MLTEIVNSAAYWKCYHLQKPDDFLSSFIDCFWENRDTAYEVLTDRSLPDIGFTLRFNLSVPYYLKKEGCCLFVNEDILFPRNFTWDEFHVKSPRVFGIKFKFSFLPYTLGIDHLHFVHRPLSLNRFLEADIIRRIHDAENFEQRVFHSANFFTSVYEKHASAIGRHAVVFELLEEVLMNEEFDFKLEKIAAEKFLSSRTLNRHFQKNIGITAKRAFRILRTRKAIASYVHDREFCVYEWGYYDYSHFYKEVKATTGLELKQLRPKP